MAERVLQAEQQPVQALRVADITAGAERAQTVPAQESRRPQLALSAHALHQL